MARLSVPVKRTPSGRRRALRGLAAGALFLAALYAALGAFAAWNAMRPKRRSPTETPGDYRLTYRRILFQSRDGVPLVGWYVPAAHPSAVVILCHGIDANKQQMLNNIPSLHRAGIAALAFDFRARGESGGACCTLGLHEVEDLRAAVRWCGEQRELAKLPIGVLGVSLGASTAIMAASETPEIRAVAAEAPFSRLDRAVECDFRRAFGAAGPALAAPARWSGEIVLGRRAESISPERSIAAISPRPVFIIEDSDDDLFPRSETRALLNAAREPKQIWTVEGAGHAGAANVAPDEYQRRILNFFASSLRSAPK